MISREELVNWLNALPNDALVGIDEGGLTLREVDGKAYLEIGGIEEEEYRDDD